MIQQPSLFILVQKGYSREPGLVFAGQLLFIICHWQVILALVYFPSVQVWTHENCLPTISYLIIVWYFLLHCNLIRNVSCLFSTWRKAPGIGFWKNLLCKVGFLYYIFNSSPLDKLDFFLTASKVVLISMCQLCFPLTLQVECTAATNCQ